MLTRTFLLFSFVLAPAVLWAWGFFGHERINRYAVYSLPPEMMALYKPNIDYLVKHSTDPDKRRYMLAEEGPRHYIDLDHYGPAPYDSLAVPWPQAAARYKEDTLLRHGVLPWHFETMLYRLTAAFKAGNKKRILKLSAEIAHYVADAHVPLHTSSNHNGQHTGQHGIHGLWESRIPELLAEEEYGHWVGRAAYIRHPRAFIWKIIGESAVAVDTVLKMEKDLSNSLPADRKYAWENRQGQLVRSYASGYTKMYSRKMGDLVERRMAAAMLAAASCWYTAWADAGQPSLQTINNSGTSAEEPAENDLLERSWRAGKIFGREH